LDVFSESARGRISASTNLTLAGKLIIRLQPGFIATATTVVTLISYSSIEYVSGNFSSVTIDTSLWSNLADCQSITFHNDIPQKHFEIDFGNCGSTNAPPSSSPSQSSKNATIISVVLVVAALAVCVGFIAWCKKKYKKKPWDRLRDDRF